MTKEANTFTNTHEPDQTEVPVEKVWEDNDNEEGFRPDSITINLLADGEKVDSIELNEENEWKHTFTELDVNKEGKAISYTVEEVTVENYETETTGNAEDGYTITNTREVEKVKVPVEKVWEDNDNEEGFRPESIVVNLLANGEAVDEAELDESNKWKHTFTELNKYADGKEINYTVEEVTVENYETETTGNATDGYTITNTRETEYIEINGQKRWADNQDQDGIRPDKITITLTGTIKDAEGNDKVVVNKTVDAVYDEETAVSEDVWTFVFEELPVYQEGQKVTYELSEENVPEGYEMTKEANTFTNTHEPDQTEIPVEKVWEDSDDVEGLRPTSITVNLLADGEKVDSVELNAENEWQHTFTELDVNKEGKAIEYTIEEIEIDNYTSDIEGSVEEGFTITNTREVDYTEKTVTKKWDDNNNQDGIRDSYEVTLYGKDSEGNVLYEDTQLLDKDTTTYKWTKLQNYIRGKAITYSVDETKVPDGYEKSVDGFTITNSHTPEETEVEITKEWDDADDQDGIRPTSITVTLYADGKEYKTETIEGTGNTWTYTFEHLPKYNGSTTPVKYTITEKEITDYEGTVDGNKITNKHIPATIDLEGYKVWKDNSDQDGIRPKSITINLTGKAKGEVVVEKSTTIDGESDEWKYEFKELPKFNAGTEIVYTVDEASVPSGYEKKVEDLIITNTHDPKKIEVSGEKTWDDADDQDGKRPSKITITLYKDGEEYKTAVANEETEWKYSFDELPQYKEHGTEIVYTIAESTVEGYSVEYGITKDETTSNVTANITNSYTPELIDISGEKTWDDADNQDGIRPETIKITLYADDEEIETTEANEETEWTYEFKELPKYRDHGTEIVYTITEETVEGYETEITDFDVTNKHTPEVVSYTITKEWDDEDDNDGIRPKKITVNLLADGEKVDSKTITEKEKWTCTFENLPKNKAGKEIVYTITEDVVEGYEAKITTNNDNKTSVTILNKHIPEKISINGKKIWKDDENNLDKRPTYIKINIYADGKYLTTIVVKSDENWEYKVENLYKFRKGQKITYTIEEEEIEGYTPAYDNYNIINYYDGTGDVIPPKTNIDVDLSRLIKDNVNIFTMLLTSVVVAKKRRIFE